MTSREKGIFALSHTDLDWPEGTFTTTAEHGRRLNEMVEASGLRIVDAELFDALVGAVRSVERMEAMRDRIRQALAVNEPCDVPQLGFDIAGDQVAAAHTRAVELLDERGE